jgi:hypothetical protein
VFTKEILKAEFCESDARAVFNELFFICFEMMAEAVDSFGLKVSNFQDNCYSFHQTKPCAARVHIFIFSQN